MKPISFPIGSVVLMALSAALRDVKGFSVEFPNGGLCCRQPAFQRNPALQMADTATKSTLTSETTWELRFVMRGLPTTKGRKVDEIFNIRAQFLEEENYEPPQGILKQIFLTSGEENGEQNKSLFQIKESRWQLSEDPSDRKDGLWVWGLFKEPLYPFLLLQVTTEKIPLPGEDGDAIEPLVLFSQINHTRDKEKGAILSRAELKVRDMETVNADLFGVSTADVYEERTIGQIVFQSIDDDESS